MERITTALNKADVVIHPLDKTASCTVTSAPTDKDAGALKYLFLSRSGQRGQQAGQIVQIPAGMNAGRMFFPFLFFSLFFRKVLTRDWARDREAVCVTGTAVWCVCAATFIKHRFPFVSMQKDILFSRTAWQRERDGVPVKGARL